MPETHGRSPCISHTTLSAHPSWWFGAYLHSCSSAPAASYPLWQKCRSLSARYCCTRVLPEVSYRTLPIDQFVENDFLCAVEDTVDISYPGHRVSGFQILCHALGCFSSAPRLGTYAPVPARSEQPDRSRAVRWAQGS